MNVVKYPSFSHLSLSFPKYFYTTTKSNCQIFGKIFAALFTQFFAYNISLLTHNYKIKSESNRQIFRKMSVALFPQFFSLSMINPFTWVAKLNFTALLQHLLSPQFYGNGDSDLSWKLWLKAKWLIQPFRSSIYFLFWLCTFPHLFNGVVIIFIFLLTQFPCEFANPLQTKPAPRPRFTFFLSLLVPNEWVKLFCCGMKISLVLFPKTTKALYL